MSPTVPVYVNGRRIEVAANATVLDAVGAWSAEAAREVSRGTRAVMDSRGLPAALGAPVYGGAIFRISAPHHAGESGDPPE